MEEMLGGASVSISSGEFQKAAIYLDSAMRRCQIPMPEIGKT